MGIAIDLNRGVMCCREKHTGTYCYMYLDQPGVYLTEQGTELSEDFAAQCGFEVEKYAKDRKKAEKLAAAMAAIDAEVADKASVVLEEAAGYQLIGLPLDRAEIIDSDGKKVTTTALSTAAARVMMKALVDAA